MQDPVMAHCVQVSTLLLCRPVSRGPSCSLQPLFVRSSTLFMRAQLSGVITSPTPALHAVTSSLPFQQKHRRESQQPSLQPYHTGPRCPVLRPDVTPDVGPQVCLRETTGKPGLPFLKELQRYERPLLRCCKGPLCRKVFDNQGF